MNIAGKLFFCGICLLCCGNAGAELIPSKEIVVPAGCSRVSGSEYIVRVPKRSNMPNTTAGLVFTPDMKQIAGKAVCFSADLRCKDIASDTEGDHVGGKLLVSYRDGSGMRFSPRPLLPALLPGGKINRADWRFRPMQKT